MELSFYYFIGFCFMLINLFSVDRPGYLTSTSSTWVLFIFSKTEGFKHVTCFLAYAFESYINVHVVHILARCTITITYCTVH